MRIFLSYKYTGVSKEILQLTIKLTYKLREKYEVFCNLERDDIYLREKWSTKEIMRECFNELDKSDIQIIFVAPGTDLGEGMLLETGYAIKKNMMTLLIMPSNFNSVSIMSIVNKIIKYDDIQFLLENIVNYIKNAALEMPYDSATQLPS